MRSAAKTPPGTHVTYIVAGYPHVSHTFIQREVLALRGLGVTVDTVTVQRSTPANVLSDEDRQEFATTFALRPFRPMIYVRAHLRAILSSDARWLGALRTSLALARVEPRSIAWRFFYFVQAVVLWDHMRSKGARHVHAHLANVASDLAMLVKEIGGADWSWSFTMHGPTEFSDESAFHLAEKARSAHFVACISDYCRSQLMALLALDQWDKLIVVHCGVDPQRFALVDVARREGPPRVVCVARMAPVKGQAILIDAVARLRDRGAPIELTLVGDGPDRDMIEGLVTRRELTRWVRFTGALGQDEVRAELAANDVLCLPSFAEGLPVVLMEAMSSGLPVVCSRIAGIPELVEDGESGFVLAPGRADLIADAIETLAREPHRRREMGLAGRRRVEEQFEVTPNAARLLTAFQSVGAS